MTNLLGKTLRKKNYLKKRKFKVIERWECDLRKLARNDQLFSSYLSKYGRPLAESLSPRESILGARVETICHCHVAKPPWKMFHVDFRSMYPAVQVVLIFLKI